MTPVSGIVIVGVGVPCPVVEHKPGRAIGDSSDYDKSLHVRSAGFKRQMCIHDHLLYMVSPSKFCKRLSEVRRYRRWDALVT